MTRYKKIGERRKGKGETQPGMKLSHNQNTVDEIQLKIYQEMSPERKLEIAMQLFHSAYSLKRAALKSQHPEWSDREIDSELRSILLHAGN